MWIDQNDKKAMHECKLFKLGSVSYNLLLSTLAVSFTATVSSALEVCEPQCAVGFSTPHKTHHTPHT